MRAVNARCVFSRVSIGAFPLEGQLPRPKKTGAEIWAVESHLGKGYRPKGRCEEDLLGPASQLARFGQPPAALNGEAAGLLFFVSDPRAVWGLLARSQPSLLPRYPKTKCGKRLPHPLFWGGGGARFSLKWAPGFLERRPAFGKGAVVLKFLLS
jgi:hypothetical protein